MYIVIKEQILHWLGIQEEVDARFDEFVEEITDGGCHENEEEDDEPFPPSRFLIQTGNNSYWVQAWKPNAIMGIDVFWKQKVGENTINVQGTIWDTNVSIFDFETTVTPEVFENMRKHTIDSAIAQAEEAMAKASRSKESGDSGKPPNASSIQVSYG